MRVRQVIPIFRLFDEQKAREFYVDYLGFQVSFEHQLEENSPLYLGLSLGGMEILHLSEHHGDATPGSTVRLEIDDIVSFNQQLAAKTDYKYARPSIVHQPWGQREVSLKDPFGNTLIVCQPDESILEQRRQKRAEGGDKD